MGLYDQYHTVMSTKTRPVNCCIVPIEPRPLPAVEQAVLVSGFKALCDATRLEIFRLIAAQTEPICACDIVDRFDVSQPTISHHLKVLKEAGLISASRRGVWAYYAAEPAGVALLDGAVKALLPVRLAATG
jgi:ArsR family transcriptional regulator